MTSFSADIIAMKLMETPKNACDQLPPWQEILATSIRCPKQLLKYLNLDQSLYDDIILGHKELSLHVPIPFASRMEKNNIDDPLLKQVLPTGDELIKKTGFVSDPLSETAHIPTTGLIHKYKGRVLLITSGVCAVNCRFCFRRHFPYNEHQLKKEQLDKILNYILADVTIKEVILSGGDPLTISDRRLANLLTFLADIPHVTTVRIHTRLPIMIPQRIQHTLLAALTQTRLKTVIVIHCNHSNEIDEHVKAALNKIKTFGITLLSQSVLLKGVNDCPKVLQALFETLFHCDVLPYYLHLLDRVQGASHFEVGLSETEKLFRELRANVPGYLVPRLVRDIASQPYKTPVYV